LVFLNLNIQILLINILNKHLFCLNKIQVNIIKHHLRFHLDILINLK